MTGPDSHPIVRLTDRQRLCLGLVHAHMSSKEIASRIGIEPGTVDQHIKAAMLILGVSERRAAARILAEYEERDRLPDQSPRIALDLETTRAASPTLDASPPAQRPAPPLPIGGGGPDKAGWQRRLAWIAAIVIGMAVAIGVLVSALEALTRIVRS